MPRVFNSKRLKVSGVFLPDYLDLAFIEKIVPDFPVSGFLSPRHPPLSRR